MRPAFASSSPKPIEFFMSFRSPYSYLAISRVFDLQRDYHVSIDYRGVRPMVTRGVPLSQEKKIYIFRDCARVARRLGIPFGRVVDPLGEGALRCLQLAELAKVRGCIEPYLRRVPRAIWSEGVDVSTDAGLRPLCEEVGLDWTDCLGAMPNETYRANVEANIARLGALGHWGVPVIAIDGETFWGQDRIESVRWRLDSLGLRR